MMRKHLLPGEKLKRGQKPKPDQYEWVQDTDWNGEPMKEQIRPYTITGLALALDTTRQTLLEYEGEVPGREKANPKFADTIKEAKLKCELYIEEGMMKGTVPPAPGIFNLKNNYEWKDEVTQTLKHENLTDLIKAKLDANRSTPKPNTKRS